VLFVELKHSFLWSGHFLALRCPSLPPPTPSTHTEGYTRVKKVRAYQMTLHSESYSVCNATAYAEWKAATGFDEQVFQGGSLCRQKLADSGVTICWDQVLVLGL
jgi:hypothetical protein